MPYRSRLIRTFPFSAKEQCLIHAFGHIDEEIKGEHVGFIDFSLLVDFYPSVNV